MKSYILFVVLLLVSLLLISCGTTAMPKQSENALGKQLFDDNCSQCHRYPDDLKDPREFLSKTVHKGGQRMPSFASTLTQAEQEAVIGYILSK